jgi:hypothetical protein
MKTSFILLVAVSTLLYSCKNYDDELAAMNENLAKQDTTLTNLTGAILHKYQLIDMSRDGKNVGDLYSSRDIKTGDRIFRTDDMYDVVFVKVISIKNPLNDSFLHSYTELIVQFSGKASERK